MSSATFAEHLLGWFDQHGRHDLPWQHPRTGYRVWLSEIMLQQTQVATVIPYFERFLSHFPDLPSLAAADLDSVLAQWAGLGYYSRARNLHRAARLCVERHGGEMPRDLLALQALPGIGRSTAAAIFSQAFDLPAPILDGNVKRVLARFHGLTEPIDTSASERRLWAWAEAHLPTRRAADYTQAIMDFGATQCTPKQPDCDSCPMHSLCRAKREQLIERIPARKPRKATPERTIRMLLIENQRGELALQRRPEVGIWGGLMSLPELPMDADWQAEAAARFALKLTPIRTLPAIRHVFTHFALRITVEHVRAHAQTVLRERDELCFFTRAELGTLGMPKPIATLLAGFDAT